jgi:hypothetical protein
MAKTRRYKIASIPRLSKAKYGSWTYDVPHRREAHEIETVNRLIKFGDDIVLLKPSKIKGDRTPDMVWRGELWEIKRPDCGDKENVARAIKDARKQSNNIVLDIARNGIERVISYIHYYFGTDKWSKAKIFVFNHEKYCVLTRNLV